MRSAFALRTSGFDAVVLDNLVAGMVKNREKVLGGGKRNNVVNSLTTSLNFVTFGLVPIMGRGCTTHADEAKRAFEHGFPGWTFYLRREENGLLGHQYVEGEQKAVGADGLSYKVVIDTWAREGNGTLNLYRAGNKVKTIGGSRQGYPRPLATGVTHDPLAIQD